MDADGPRRRPVNARPRVRLDGGVPAALCSAPVKHDVGGLSERPAHRTPAHRTCARVAIASGARQEHCAVLHALPPLVQGNHLADLDQRRCIAALAEAGAPRPSRRGRLLLSASVLAGKRTRASVRTAVLAALTGTHRRPGGEIRRQGQGGLARVLPHRPGKAGVCRTVGAATAARRGCRTNRSEIKRVNVPWDTTMQDSRNADAGWGGTSEAGPDQDSCSHHLVQSRIHQLCATASVQSGSPGGGRVG
jgi:hypothetical protein